MALIGGNEREPCNRHFRPEAMAKEERLAAMKAAPLLLGWVGDRSAGMVLEPSVFEIWLYARAEELDKIGDGGWCSRWS